MGKVLSLVGRFFECSRREAIIYTVLISLIPVLLFFSFLLYYNIYTPFPDAGCGNLIDQHIDACRDSMVNEIISRESDISLEERRSSNEIVRRLLERLTVLESKKDSLEALQ